MVKQIFRTYVILVFLGISLPFSLCPQSIRRSVGIIYGIDEIWKPAGMMKDMSAAASYNTDDTLYCTQVRRVHGWLMPLDTISKEDASHRSLSFRFVHRYPSGYWGKMETIDGYGNRVFSTLSPYILKLRFVNFNENTVISRDVGADWIEERQDDWFEKLQNSCIYEFIADASGKNVIQERVYGKDGNILYTYSRVPIGNGQYIGSYKDSYGLPAEMRKDSLFAYGTLVRLTEDQWGNDSIVEYIDAKGKCKPTPDGVAMDEYIYDEYGHLLKSWVRDRDGNLIVDQWGNCGLEYEWNAHHQNVSAMYMDDKWQPMRMSDNRSAQYNNVIKIRYKYDRYGRNTEEAYYTADDVPDTNAYGVHRTVCAYDDRGNITEVVNYDKNGAPTENSTGTAFVMHEYDDAGRTIRSVYLGKDRRPCSTEGYLSGVVYRYDEEGNRILYEEYSVVDGKEIKSYMEETGKDYSFVRWEDGSTMVDSLDTRGRITLRAYYDKDGNPDKSKEFAFNRMEYAEFPHQLRYTDSYYDSNGHLCNPFGDYAVQVVVRDTLSESVRSFIRRYDEQGVLTTSYIWRYDKNGNILSEDDANAYGVTCRAGGNFSIRYYRGKVMYSTPEGRLSSFIGRDEFGEPDYVSFKTGIYYYVKYLNRGGAWFYDENNQPITDQGQFKDACPKLMTIEVTDSAAYRLGLRDNDVILVDGDYAVDVFAPDSVQVSFEEFIKDWTIHSVLDGSRNRRMVVFRVNPETLEYGLVEINGLKGSPSELGYLAHIRYLTRKQLRRIQDSVKENMESDSPLVRRSDLVRKDYSGDNLVIMTFTDMYRDVRYNLYSREVTDPSILLGACMKEGNMTWKFGDTSSDAFRHLLNARTMTVLNSPVQHFYLTRNGKDVIDLEDGGQALQLDGWWEVNVSDEVYRKLAALSGKVETMLESEMTDVPLLDKKDLVDNWVLKLSGNGYEPYIQVSLLKDGTMKGYIEQYDSIAYKGGHALFRIRQNLDGRWADCGNILEFTYQDENTVSLECIGLSGIDPLLETRSLAFVNKSTGENPQYYLNRMNVRILGRFAYVKDLSKDRLVIDDGTADGLTLYRVSRRHLKDSSGKDG